MELKQQDKKNKLKIWFKDNIALFIGMLSFFTILFVVLTSLSATNVVEWKWLTGYILGFTICIFATLLIPYSIKSLVTSENPYFYVFLILLRYGLYVVPFLISIYLNSYFSFFGVCISLGMIIIYPFLRWKDSK